MANREKKWKIKNINKEERKRKKNEERALREEKQIHWMKRLQSRACISAIRHMTADTTAEKVSEHG